MFAAGKMMRISAGPWWLSGGLAPADCLVAYQSKNAASLAASYVNLANPGTYDASVVNAPTWSAGIGWTFNGSSNQLNCAYTPVSQKSWIVKITASSATNRFPFLSGTGSNSVGTLPNWTASGGSIAYYNGQSAGKTPAVTSGSHVLAVAGTKAYRNGSDEGITIPAWIGSGTTINIGVPGANGWNSVIEAIAFYNRVLTASEVAAISSALLTI
jgi:hypothetical protein